MNTKQHTRTSAVELDFSQGPDVLEMSRYIDLDLYHAVERSHPYYVEMIADIQAVLRDVRRGTGQRLLELGAGTGLATEAILGVGGFDVDALELDAKCCTILAEHTKGGASCIQGDATTFCRRGHYDFVASVFAHDHIHYDEAVNFARNIRNNLKPGGFYIMGGEILPFFQSEEERVEALHTYHGFIVQKALRDGHFELAQIEINALKSGIFKIGDFKRHEALFENEMLSADFRLFKKTKIGPGHLDDVGGVYVYVFQAV